MASIRLRFHVHDSGIVRAIGLDSWWPLAFPWSMSCRDQVKSPLVNCDPAAQLHCPTTTLPPWLKATKRMRHLPWQQARTCRELNYQTHHGRLQVPEPWLQPARGDWQASQLYTPTRIVPVRCYGLKEIIKKMVQKIVYEEAAPKQCI